MKIFKVYAYVYVDVNSNKYIGTDVAVIVTVYVDIHVDVEMNGNIINN